jgi:NAD(P)H-dependent FMN reductase
MGAPRRFWSHEIGASVTHLLTVSGSLRAGSSNAALLAAAGRVAPAGVTVSAYQGLGALPAFNPDLEEGPDPAPNAVAHWRAALAAADAVLISSPEYAHGIPGVLKNALDWVVGSGELVGKRVGLLSASAASHFAHPQLVEVLTVMSAALVPEATVVLDIPRRGVSAEQLAADPVVGPALERVVSALAPAVAC